MTDQLVEGEDFEPSGPGGLPPKVMARISCEGLPSLLGMVVLAVLDQTKIIRGADHDEKDVLAVRTALSGIKTKRAFEEQAKALAVTMESSKVWLNIYSDPFYFTNLMIAMNKSDGTCPQ